MSYNENFTMYSVRTEPFDFCWGGEEGGWSRGSGKTNYCFECAKIPHPDTKVKWWGPYIPDRSATCAFIGGGRG